MIIGIDFDNTIIDYSFLFTQIAHEKGWISSNKSLTKAQVKQQLISMDGNDLRWQELQSIVYGQEIYRAKPFQGFVTFLQEVTKNNDTVYIISHKTEYSNYDKTIELVKPAIIWLKENKIMGSNALIAEKNVFFYPDRKDKINKIKQIKCDVFIDDLAVVLVDKLFPNKTLGLLFSDKQKGLIHANQWKDFLQFYRLSCKFDIQWLISTSKLLKSLIVDISPSNHGGNNFLQTIHCLNGAKYFLKTAKKEKVHTLKNDYNALNLLNKYHIKAIAKPLFFSEKRAELIQSFLPGEQIKQVKNYHIDGLVKFIFSLENLDQNKIKYVNIGNYRSKYSDYEDAINTRWELINKDIFSLRDKYPVFNKVAVLLRQIKPLKDNIIKKFNEQILHYQLNSKSEFPEQEKIFNPSDFGFHNVLENDSSKQLKELYFIDFEYFVYDDKAKMVCDFIHHAGHQLTLDQKLYFLQQLNNQNFYTPTLKQRIILLINLVGFEWLLIILNITQKDKLKQKIHANPELSVDQLVETQYDKAQKLLSFFQKNIAEKKEFFTLGLYQRELKFD